MMAASPRMRNALTLFSSNDCVLCHRVRLVLAAKGVTYDLIPVDPQNPPEDLVDLNPYHSVPTLVEHDWVPQVQAIQLGNKAQADAGRKRLKELLTASVPLFKAFKFFLNTEMSLADCAMAPIVWRLPALGVPLPKDGKAIEDYGNRIFRSPGFTRSQTEQERRLRDLPA